MRYFFEVAYNGTRYHGWQAQKNATSVQEEITSRLSTKLRYPVDIVGSGRTDAGVHATQQYFHVDFKEEMEIDTFMHDFNGYLPGDITIKSIRKVNPEAHARFDAVLRSYAYHFLTRKNPFLENQGYHYYTDLDVPMMEDASQFLIGDQDFEAFSKVKTDVANFLCSIKEVKWVQTPDSIVMHISANRFLRGMVRAIVGTLLEVGTGKKQPKHIREVINAKDRRKAGAAVPACGLFLTGVEYPSTIFI
jgi:tRNA pseudouridine38-40 synthase